MSMLAERKRKQRLTLNPRGKLWTEDRNGFGQKMLKKMGWSSGKGLGANEDGNTEMLRVSYKNDNKGMGYQETEQWTAHDDNFSRLLENLNGNNDKSNSNSIKINSLETKVQNTKARINYHKFTKAKDLSRYTEKDLANIFGKKTLKQEPVKEANCEIDEKTMKSGVILEENDKLLLNKGSMADYFKKKLSKFKTLNSEYKIGNNGVLTIEKSDSENERPAFGFSKESDDNSEDTAKKKKRKYTETFFSYLRNTEGSESIERKKSKNNKLNDNLVYKSNEEIVENKLMQNGNELVLKTRKANEIVGNFVSYLPKGDEFKNTENVKDTPEVDLSVVKQKIKKKSKLSEGTANECQYNKNYFVNSPKNCDANGQREFNCEIIKEKKSKKPKHKDKKHISEELNEENIVNQDEICLSRDEIHCAFSKNKLKIEKSKDSSLDYEAQMEDMEENSSENDGRNKNENDIGIHYNEDEVKEIPSEIEVILTNEKGKKRKKKRNKENGDADVTNIVFRDVKDDNLNNRGTENHFVATACEHQKMDSKNYQEGIEERRSEKKKKNKSKHSILEKIEMKEEDVAKETTMSNNELISQTHNDKQINGNFEDTEAPRKVKKSKKSKKSKNEECDNIGISNPAFDDFTSNNNSLQDDSKNEENVSNGDAPKKKKRKRKHEEVSEGGIDNPLFDENVDNSNATLNEEQSNPYEVKIKKNKTSTKEANNSGNIGLDNPALNLNESIPDTDLILNIASTPTTSKESERSWYPYEFKVEKRKVSDETTNKLDNVGLDNPALSLNSSNLDTDFMLNIVNTPTILKKYQEKLDLKASSERAKRSKRKSVRFSDVLQERIIPNDPSERTNKYISDRNELFDINTSVVEDGVREEMKKQGMTYQRNDSSLEFNSSDPKEINRKVVESSVKEELNRGLNCGFINNGFDIRSVDKINFYEDKYEVKSPNSKGIDNEGFNKTKNRIEENVESISNTIESYQAEVENDINEAKIDQELALGNWMVGDVGAQIQRNLEVAEGTKLCFKKMHFKTAVPNYLRHSVNTSKKTYRHLIRGDITVAFKNSNLHVIEGYAVRNRENFHMF